MKFCAGTEEQVQAFLKEERAAGREGPGSERAADRMLMGIWIGLVLLGVATDAF